VRFAAEVEGVEKVMVNDISKRAVQIAKHNVQMNRLEKKVVVKHEEANVLLSSYGAPRKRFDAIDVDPFGSPVPYVDSAVRALKDRGFIALTATDMAPLCGVHPKACIRKYGGKPLRTEYCHELAIRLLAGCLATVAAKHEIGIAAVFSHSAEHYIRLYATIKHGAKNTDESLRNMGYVLHCFRCFHRESFHGLAVVGHDGKCSECGSKLSAAGPLWLGRLADRQFCELMEREAKQMTLANSVKIERILALAEGELEGSVGYYVVDKLCDFLGLPVPAVKKVAEAIRNEGFEVSATRFNPRGIKSDVPAVKLQRLLKEMMKA
jgi:tRNA (guanine26-N2/guanine27-N2)-dimethyltransferase